MWRVKLSELKKIMANFIVINLIKILIYTAFIMFRSWLFLTRYERITGDITECHLKMFYKNWFLDHG